MIPVENLKEVGVIFTHKNCPDGMATAMILKDAFRMLGMSPRIEFLAHNTPEHKGAIGRHYLHSQNTRALFCDIAPHPDVYRDHIVAGDIVLDHHKGVEELVRSFGPLGVFADEKLEPGVSGAVLAWREVWEPINRDTGTHDFLLGSCVIHGREFAACVGARDTWQTTSPKFLRGQHISKMLMSKPASYWLHGDERPFLAEEEIQCGRALFEAHEEAVRQAVGQCVIFEMPEGQKKCVLLYIFQEQASGFRLTSDVAEAIRAGADNGPGAVAGFSYVVNKPGEAPVLLYSLRGLNGFNVAALAKQNGGGGHTAAAGFSVPAAADNPYELIRVRLVDFLRTEAA